jgi:hypothetical protein
VVALSKIALGDIRGLSARIAALIKGCKIQIFCRFVKKRMIILILILNQNFILVLSNRMKNTLVLNS